MRISGKMMLCVLLLIMPLLSVAQTQLRLEDVVHIARTQSLSARKAYVENRNAYWNYRIYKSDLNPQLRLDTRLAEFSKGVMPVGQEDGSIMMKTVNQNSSQASLSLLQPLPGIGAEIFLNSDLMRFDNFTSDLHSYSSQPVKLGISMPVMKFNALRWDQKIEPIRYEEAQKTYDKNLEYSAWQAVEMFFQNLYDRHELSMADANRKMNKTLLRIADQKFQKGQISRDELLQIRLMMVNSQKEVQTAQVEMLNSGLRLMTHLSLTDVLEFKPIVPQTIPNFEISSSQALNYARDYNPESIAFKRRLLEADREVSRTRGATGINGDLSASIGYSSNFDDLPQWNNDLNQHARLKIALSIPIIDWGRTRAARKKAAMRKELEETSVLQERISFEKEVISLVNVVEMLKENIKVVEEAESIARERYEIAYKRYLADDISVLELNLAQKEKDYASRNLLAAKGDFWIKYHKLRMVTLFDFIDQKTLVSIKKH